MSNSARRAALSLTASTLTFSAMAVLALTPHGARAGTTGPYLTWQGKTDTAPPQAQFPVSVPSNPVPPSPYGQVGDPFVHTLNWPGKPAPQSPAQVQPEAVASVVMPSAQPQPKAPVTYIPPPQPLSQPPVAPRPAPLTVPEVSVPLPQPSNQAPIAPQPARPVTAPVVTAPPPAEPAKPVVATQAPVRDTTPAPKPTLAHKPAPEQPPAPAIASNSTPPATGDYEVPSSSKYAARIAAARAATQPEAAPVAAPAVAAAPVAKPAKAAPSAPQPQATAPEPAEPLAAQETDHVFIPGEHYTSTADEPRYYSLHRQYGIRPDPITVTPDATGAILDTSHIDAQEKADAKADAKDDSGDSDSDASSSDDNKTDN